MTEVDAHKRVLMITTDHLMIDRRILQEARSLREAGYRVSILAGFECAMEESYERDGIPIRRHVYNWDDTRAQKLLRRVRNRQGRFWSLLWRATRKAISLATGISSFEHFVLRKAMDHEFDILHVHDFPLLNVGVEIKKRTGRIVVYDAHELYHAQSQLMKRTQKAYRLRESKLIHKVDAAITVNPFVADIMAEDYGCRRPHVILNAAPTRKSETPTRDIREYANLAAGTRVVLYQGWLSPERGIDKLVRTARHFPAGTSLVLVGYGDHERDLRGLSGEQGTDDGRVVFLGKLESDVLQQLTGSADLGVIPYWGIDLNNTYCSPNKLFEFAVAGLPFVANELPYLRSVVDGYGYGVLGNLRDDMEAARLILHTLDDLKKMSELRAAANQAGQTLNWEIEGEKLLAIYRGLDHRAA
jgi:glycosyltransferase involved in cell wall biosynthesis